MHESLPNTPVIEQSAQSPVNVLDQLGASEADVFSPFNPENITTPDWLKEAGQLAVNHAVEQPMQIGASVAETAEQSKFQKAKQLFLGKVSFKKTVESTSFAESNATFKFMTLSSKASDKASENFANSTASPFNYTSEYQKSKIPTWGSADYNQNSNPFMQPGSAEQAITKPEAPRRQGEFVKTAPKFSEQVLDGTRTDLVEYVNGTRTALGTKTEGRASESLTEQESITGLQSFLTKITQNKGMPGSSEAFSANQAASMLENMTFIGNKEYDEATKGIAEMWSTQLRENPKSQICAIIGKISPGMVKSDAYLLDNILKNFSNEQLGEFSGRLVLDPEDLTADSKDVRIIMLDDWTISGSQLTEASEVIIAQHPQYREQIEVQLIAATEQRITNGLAVLSDGRTWSAPKMNIPVNAYYAAHAAPREFARSSGAHITGAHCAVDFDFNDNIARMASQSNIDMPPATNIVRPYRRQGVRLAQTERLQGLPSHIEQPSVQNPFFEANPIDSDQTNQAMQRGQLYEVY